MTGLQRLIVSGNLGEFFHREVAKARSQLGVDLPELTEYYVVRLLCDFSRHDASPTKPGSEPLVLIYKKAVEASLTQRIQILKQLGDVSLYMAGFFADFVEQSLVDLNYYIAMGGGAYGHLSGLVGNQKAMGELYGQLSTKFTELVDILNEISERNRDSVSKNTELLKMYDRWVRTRSDRLRKLLIDKGLTPDDSIPTEYVQ